MIWFNNIHQQSLSSQPRHPYPSLLLHCHSQVLSIQQQQPHICIQWSLQSDWWQPGRITCLGRGSWLLVSLTLIIATLNSFVLSKFVTLQIVFLFGIIFTIPTWELFGFYLFRTILSNFILKSRILFIKNIINCELFSFSSSIYLSSITILCAMHHCL